MLSHCSEWITLNIAGCDGDTSGEKHLWLFCVDIAEKAVLSRGHPCIVCYHGDPVQLGERLAGRADWVAVPLPQKQEAVCVASRHRHQERWLPRKSGGTCQWKGEGESLQPASASCLNSTHYMRNCTLKISKVYPALVVQPVSLFPSSSHFLWIKLKVQRSFSQQTLWFVLAGKSQV